MHLKYQQTRVWMDLGYLPLTCHHNAHGLGSIVLPASPQIFHDTERTTQQITRITQARHGIPAG